MGVVIVYEDAPAGKRALHTLEGGNAPVEWKHCVASLALRFDLHGRPDWRAWPPRGCISRLVVISTTSKGELPAAAQALGPRWSARTAGPSPPWPLLLGRRMIRTQRTSRFQFLKGAAEAAGVDFFAPTPPAARPTPARFSHHILLVEDERTVLPIQHYGAGSRRYQVTPVEGCESRLGGIQSGVMTCW